MALIGNCSVIYNTSALQLTQQRSPQVAVCGSWGIYSAVRLDALTSVNLKDTACHCNYLSRCFFLAFALCGSLGNQLCFAGAV